MSDQQPNPNQSASAPVPAQPDWQLDGSDPAAVAEFLESMRHEFRTQLRQVTNGQSAIMQMLGVKSNG